MSRTREGRTGTFWATEMMAAGRNSKFSVSGPVGCYIQLLWRLTAAKRALIHDHIDHCLTHPDADELAEMNALAKLL